MGKRDFQEINLSITKVCLLGIPFFKFQMTYSVKFDFVEIITLNWLIFPLHKVQKSSCINKSFD